MCKRIGVPFAEDQLSEIASAIDCNNNGSVPPFCCRPCLVAGADALLTSTHRCCTSLVELEDIQSCFQVMYLGASATHTSFSLAAVAVTQPQVAMRVQTRPVASTWCRMVHVCFVCSPMCDVAATAPSDTRSLDVLQHAARSLFMHFRTAQEV